MILVTLALDPGVYAFYAAVGKQSGHAVEQVMADALYKLAGELSIQALKKKQIEDCKP
ncbi:MAG: hypothetical protein IJ453_01615 [Oscillospiraceae bacterium]|nr:hypothetical protein [Oscillospiraceae bacterium]